MIQLAGYIYRLRLLKLQRKLDEYQPLINSNTPPINIESLQNITIIDYSEILVSNLIGQGSYGSVYKGEYRGQMVAIKKGLPNSNLSSDETLKELQVQFRLSNHPNVVKLIGFCASPTCLVLEYCKNSSVKHFLTQYRVQIELKLQWLFEVCSGVLHIHKHDIIHRDLAARNVLLDRNLVAKISDFGLSRHTSNPHGYTESFFGPVKWMSPESLRNQRYSKVSDVWSFGILILEIETRDDPFPDYAIPTFLLEWNSLMAKLNQQLPKDTLPKLAELMGDCTNMEPEDRPTFDDILNRLVHIRKTYSTLEESFSERVKKIRKDLRSKKEIALVADDLAPSEVSFQGAINSTQGDANQAYDFTPAIVHSPESNCSKNEE